MDRQRGGEAALAGGAEGASRRLPAGPEPLAEVRNRSGPEGDVDERVEVEEPLALGQIGRASCRERVFRTV